MKLKSSASTGNNGGSMMTGMANFGTVEKPHLCVICKQRFRSRANFKTHQRLHSPLKPFACDLCPARFNQLVHLELHKILHTNQKPYPCQGCNQNYITASGLRTHWKTTSCGPNKMEEITNAAAAMSLRGCNIVCRL